jgi:mannuronan 5-epimerase
VNHLLKKKSKKYNGNPFVASKSCAIIVIVFVPLLILLLLSLLTNFMKDVYDAYSIPSLSSSSSSSSSSCISYNPTIKLITVGCKSANLTDVYNQINDQAILSKQESSSSFRTFPSSSSNNIWLLSANLTIAQGATFYINSTDTAWLKINANYAISSHTSNNNNNNNNNNSAAYGIQVFGNLKIDSVKITSWNPETNDYASVKTTTTTTTNTKPVNGPFIIVQNGATDTTDITKSEIAYLTWLSYFGGNGSVLRGNNIHNLSFGFYSKGVSGMVFENNDVHDNGLYGIDPHTGTHDMIIRNNNVHNDGSIDIICSLDCYNITIEGNKVYNNSTTPKTIGIMFSRNTSNSVARNNVVQNEAIGVSVSISNNNKVSYNSVSNAINGIFVTGGSYKTKEGIKFSQGSHNNTIDHNIIVNSSSAAIVVKGGAFGNIFYSNTVRNAHFAIDIPDPHKTKNNTFRSNRLINSSSSSLTSPP